MKEKIIIELILRHSISASINQEPNPKVMNTKRFLESSNNELVINYNVLL